MRKILFTSSVFAFGFIAGYTLSLRINEEIFTQTQKRAKGDYSYNEKSFISRCAKTTLDEAEVQNFSESLDKLR